MKIVNNVAVEIVLAGHAAGKCAINFQMHAAQL